MVVLTVVCVVGCGLVGGVFFAFSAFVMKALAHLPPPAGIAAMQSINTAAPTPLFMTALFGTGAACVALAVASVLRLDEPSARCQLAGSALYLVAIVLTVAYHVPRNDALAAVDPRGIDAAGEWSRYLSGWTAWNHVRAAVSLAAAATLTVAVRVG